MTQGATCFIRKLKSQHEQPPFMAQGSGAKFMHRANDIAAVKPMQCHIES